jgi:hypothetical protein
MFHGLLCIQENKYVTRITFRLFVLSLGAYPNPFGRVGDGVVQPPLYHASNLQFLFRNIIYRQKIYTLFWFLGLKCVNCDQLGHHKRYCPQPKKSDRARTLRCNRCGIQGHPFRECPSHNEWLLKTLDMPSQLGKLKCLGKLICILTTLIWYRYNGNEYVFIYFPLDMSHKVAKIWNVKRAEFYDFKKCILNAFQKTHKTRGAVVMTLPWHEDFPYVSKWTNERATYSTQFYSKIEVIQYMSITFC